jgi:predicted nucleic acid-binding protein
VLLYLDLNCFNRPFDDQGQVRIAEETQAVFSILQRVENGADEIAWSAVLTFENSQHPLVDRRDEISRWEQRAVSSVGITDVVSRRADELAEAGFHALDAAHLASAEAANCDRFLTCDDRLLRNQG